MKNFFLLLLFAPGTTLSRAQIYFPPSTGTSWTTLSPESQGYCEDSVQKLYDYLEETNTDAFLLLKDGKIVLEQYFGTFTQATPHVWNSAGKTLTALAVGIAQEEGYLSISDTTSDYLGTGWTNLTPGQEEKITIRHQLTMTSGLNDAGDVFCTDPECLTYLADPGTRWAYHNGPYTLLDAVIESATGMTLNNWTTQKIESITGMTGQFFQVDYNNIYISNARSMARFGILLQSQGIWNGTPVLDDADYFHDMTHASQSINPAYGYLTWLNGSSHFMVPQSQFVFQGSAMPNAPSDVFAALGKESQLINVSHSEGLVLVRMGADDGASLVSTQYNDTIWQYINRLQCTLGVDENELSNLLVSPNPGKNNASFVVSGIKENDELSMTDCLGNVLNVSFFNGSFSCENLVSGMYFINVNRSGRQKVLSLFID